ncbi:MAG: ATP-dependent Clp protease ATP-binding subunit, partial [Clostridia bacterium]|nr:ATP-dependent Clp protease ATP-binding subunit [Clostridia bacterium]
IGEPGVGKTAIAEALAQRIADGTVPHRLKNREIFVLDMTSLVAGTQFRGQFENRIRALITEVKKCGNVILMIDEIHTLVSAGDAEGGMNAANILKPALSRGEIQVIGATTLTEYRKHIEKDTALERRFQSVLVDEPSIGESIEILNGVAPHYEAFHHIRIPPVILADAVRLSERYITDRFLPDKAIDLIDEAASRASLDSKVLERLAVLTDERAEQNRILEEALAETEPTDDTYAKIAHAKTALAASEEEFNALLAKRDTEVLTRDDLAAVIEIWKGIPAASIRQSEWEKIASLPNKLRARLKGQDEAIDALFSSIRRNRAGISPKHKPASFLFAGPTGVGKTELVKQLAVALFDSEEALIRLDMSEYMEKHAVSRIIGSPPGYVGYDEAGQLTEKIRRKPYSVVLFDEIEKAHPEVLNILLQILDDGRITDSHGKRVNFENTVIVMTTNAGSAKGEAVGFSRSQKEQRGEHTKKALLEFLRPEFLNRIDEIITFSPLSEETMVEIASIMLSDIRDTMKENGITLTYTDDICRHAAREGYSEKYGARHLRRFLQKNVEDKIAALLLDSWQTPPDEITLCITDGELIAKA